MRCALSGPQYPLSPKAVEGVIIHLNLPAPSGVSAQAGNLDFWGSREGAEEDPVLQEMFTHPRAKPETGGPNQTFPF